MKLYRNTIWYFKGLKEYTKSGFETASKKFNPADLDVSCHGKTYMITGANSGLGKQVKYRNYQKLVLTNNVIRQNFPSIKVSDILKYIQYFY